jgi:DNA polymerase III delta subunit
MIYVLYGNDFEKSRAKVREIVASQIKKNRDASYFRITTEGWNPDSLEEFIGGRGLFQNKFIVVLDGLVGSKESADVVLGALVRLQESENIFIILEEKLTKEVVKKLEKRAEKVQVFEKKEGVEMKEGEFNVFALTDVFGSRDRKNLWVLYQKALFSGMAPEEIHRLLFWQVKAMLAPSITKSAGDAGLNPFVYKKALVFSKNFSHAELVKSSSELVRMYHDERRGRSDLSIDLERFLLGV